MHAESPAPGRLIASAMAFWPSAVLLSAHAMGLFAQLATGPCDAGALAQRLGLLPEVTTDLLKALLALGLVERCDEQYRNSTEASLYLGPAKPAYIGRWLAMVGAALREIADLTSHPRATGASKEGGRSPAERMWADIAEILRAGSAPDA